MLYCTPVIVRRLSFVRGRSTPLTGSASLPGLSPLTTFDPTNVVIGEDYAKGLYEMVMYVKDRYGLPSIITETGAHAELLAKGGTYARLHRMQFAAQRGDTLVADAAT